jgi:hypothetical protein
MHVNGDGCIAEMRTDIAKNRVNSRNEDVDKDKHMDWNEGGYNDWGLRMQA